MESKFTFAVTCTDFKQSDVKNFILGSRLNQTWSVDVIALNAHIFAFNLLVDIKRSDGIGNVTIDLQIRRKFVSEKRNDSTHSFNAELLDSEDSVRINTGLPISFIHSSSIYGTVIVKEMKSLDKKPEEESCSIPEKPITSLEVLDDYVRLLDTSDNFSDAILKCGTYEINVHKCILSIRSPVFEAMFKNEKMKEGREGVVDITDIDPDVLKVMLKFVYSGKLDGLTDSLSADLLFAAEKYQLGALKTICVDKLKKSLDLKNVVRNLVLGDLYDESLKENVKRFVCERIKFSELEATEEWKTLQSERPLLAIEVLTYALKLRENK